MSLWTFRCYVDAQGNDVIDQWYRTQPPKLRAKFDARLHYLRAQPRSGWVRPYFDILKNDCAGLAEIRFEFNNVQYRPLGCFSGELNFTFLLVALEKQRKFVPPNACTQALARKNEIATDARRSHACNFE